MRVAHANLNFRGRTTFDDLHRAIDIIKDITEKYLLLVYGRTFDLDKDMKDRKIQKGWDAIFLIPCAKE